MDLSNILPFLGFLGACFVAASSGAIFKPGTWYEGLAKPWWRPPNWLFGPAWGVLYISIAVAGWMVWREAGFVGAGAAIAVWGGLLVLNFFWSAFFFGLRRPDWAMGELVLLWLSILATILIFHPILPSAAWLLVPYLCWVTFAGYLNFTIWQMNKERWARVST